MNLHKDGMNYYSYNIIQNMDLPRSSYKIKVEYDPPDLCNFRSGKPYARFDMNDYELEVVNSIDITDISDDTDSYIGHVYVTLTHPLSIKVSKRFIKVSWILNKTIDWSEETKAIAHPNVEVTYESDNKSGIVLRLLGPSDIRITQDNNNWSTYKYLLKQSINLSRYEYRVTADISDSRIQFDEDTLVLKVKNDPTINTTVTLTATNIYNNKVFIKTIKVGS